MTKKSLLLQRKKLAEKNLSFECWARFLRGIALYKKLFIIIIIIIIIICIIVTDWNKSSPFSTCQSEQCWCKTLQ